MDGKFQQCNYYIFVNEHKMIPELKKNEYKLVITSCLSNEQCRGYNLKHFLQWNNIKEDNKDEQIFILTPMFQKHSHHFNWIAEKDWIDGNDGFSAAIKAEFCKYHKGNTDTSMHM